MQDGAALTVTANRQKLWDYQAKKSQKKKPHISQKSALWHMYSGVDAHGEPTKDYQKNKSQKHLEKKHMFLKSCRITWQKILNFQLIGALALRR